MWKSALAAHTDQEFAKYTLEGLEQGFRIGLNHDKAVLRQICHAPTQEVEEYLNEELKLNRLVRLNKEEAASSLQPDRDH